ncbi:regulatory protein RecX [Actinomyces provencensis]|uniref:regulatory protein RecX n=1 Tax=Actinomyces provencensis TaxID=1720198 RepID=UPI00096A9228|nr:regulatory protein RecX [Actinomyces provencensis]
MVRYADPEDHPELGEDRSRPRTSPAERLARRRERNAALTGVEAIEGAREVALRKLDARACSRAELQRAMTERGFSEDVATEVLDRLEAVGLVDDRTFAAMLVRDRFSGSGRTGRALVEDLRRRGLDREVIEEALAQVDRDDELERARDLVSHKMRSLGSLDRERAYRRLTGMLARKGYSPGTCSAVASEALSAREE